MTTDPGDLVFDPFGGSCVTGEVAERLERKWVCVELVEAYLRGAKGRFVRSGELPLADTAKVVKAVKKNEDGYYRIPHPGLLWNGNDATPLAEDGGKQRPKSMYREDSSIGVAGCDPAGVEKVGKERQLGAFNVGR